MEEQFKEITAINYQVVTLLKKQLQTLASRIENETNRVFETIAKLYKSVAVHKKNVEDMMAKVYAHRDIDKNFVKKLQVVVEDYLGENKSTQLEDNSHPKDMTGQEVEKFYQSMKSIGKQEDMIMGLTEPLILELQYNDRIRQGLERTIKVLELLDNLNGHPIDPKELKTLLNQSDQMEEIKQKIKTIYTHLEEQKVFSKHFGLQFDSEKKKGVTLF